MKTICLFLILIQNFLSSQAGITTVSVAPDSTHTNQGVTTAREVPATHGVPCQDLVLAKNATLETPDQDVVLSCALGDGVEANGGMTWFKKGVEIKADSKGYAPEGYTLKVIKVGSDDVGEYFCAITVNGQKCNVSLHLESAPQIKHFEPDTKNLVQGDPLVLECNMWGWPHPQISWKFNGSVLNDTRMKITPNSHGVADAKLRLENVDYPDGGVYECVGRNERNESSSAITVFIKNKYAALWPFLGICVEVAILCTIIFIYERRHAKKLAEEEEEEAKQEEAEHLASNNEKKEFDDIRHRDVKT